MGATTIDQTIGARVREIRTARQIKQMQLAERMGLTQGRLSQLESGSPWMVQQLASAAERLGVDVRDLIPAVGVPAAQRMLSQDESTLVDLAREASDRKAGDRAVIRALVLLLKLRFPKQWGAGA